MSPVAERVTTPAPDQRLATLKPVTTPPVDVTRPSVSGIARQPTSLQRRNLLPPATTGLAALLSIASADVPLPQTVRVVLAVLMVFVLPGFLIAYSVSPARRLASIELALASLGISLAIATCTAVLLGATPIGISSASFAVALGGVTLALSVMAVLRAVIGIRSRRADIGQDNRQRASEGVRS